MKTRGGIIGHAAVLSAAGLAVGAVALLAPSKHHDTVIGVYSTDLAGRTASQRRNAELALQKLRGAVVRPGEVFSFNSRVGSWSLDQGYRRAPVSYNGTLIASWGGGVCQTSTTLYNAALLAGMEIVERSPHRFCPGYVAPGRDAAVAYDDIDLKFKNTLPFAVRIEGSAKDGRLTLELVGPKRPAQRPQIITEVESVTQPQLFRIKRDAGTNQLTNTGKPGYDVATYRIWSGSRELISEDSYPVMNRIEE